MTIIPVILSGGAGTRLWPLSWGDHPKQFLPLVSEKTMIQETLLRLKGLNVETPIVCCGEGHRFLVAQQIGEVVLRDENNGIPGDPDFGSEMLFPEGMDKLQTPYVEAGVGLSNIFKVLRVDAVWRLTHRDRLVDGVMVPPPNRFVVNLGFKFNL